MKMTIRQKQEIALTALLLAQRTGHKRYEAEIRKRAAKLLKKKPAIVRTSCRTMQRVCDASGTYR